MVTFVHVESGISTRVFLRYPQSNEKLTRYSRIHRIRNQLPDGNLLHRGPPRVEKLA